MRTETRSEIVKQALQEINTDSNILVIYTGDSYFLCERDNHFYYFEFECKLIRICGQAVRYEKNI